MSAKIVYDSLQKIPENLRPNATKTDSGFEVDAKPLLDNHAQLSKEVQRFRAANEKLREFGDIDPAAARRAMQEVERLQQADKDAQKAVQEATAKLEKANRQQVDVLLKHIADTEISRVISEAGGSAPLLKPHLNAVVKPDVQGGRIIIRVLNESGDIRRDAAGLPVSLESLVAGLKSNPDFAGAFRSPSQTTASAGDNSQPTPSGTQRYQRNDNKIVLTRAQGRDVKVWRDAVKRVGMENVIVENE